MSGDETRRNGEADSRVDDEDEVDNSVEEDSSGRPERPRGHQQRIPGWPGSSTQENGLRNNLDDHTMQGT